jgi:hypothetical protein
MEANGQDLAHMYLVCTEMLQLWTKFDYRIWTAQQTKSSRKSKSSMLKTTQNSAIFRYRVLCIETGEK